MQSLFKIGRHFLIADLRISFKNNFESVAVTEKNEIDFIIEGSQLNGEHWNDKLTIGWVHFIEFWKSYFNINLKKFFLNFGFVPRQKRIIISSLTKHLTIHDSKLLYMIKDEPTKSKKCQEQEVEVLKRDLNSRFRSFIKEHSYEDKLHVNILEDFHKHLNKSKGNGPIKDNHDITKNSSHNVRVVSPDDPSYGQIGECIDKIKDFSGMEVLNYYNTLKIKMGQRYHITIYHKGYKINLKIELFHGNEIAEHLKFIKIISYSALQGIIDYLYINDQMNQVLPI